MAKIKIPAPSKEINLAWTRAGVGGNKLVFNKNTEQWEIVRAGETKGYHISFSAWTSGEKSFDSKEQFKSKEVIEKETKETAGKTVSNEAQVENLFAGASVSVDGGQTVVQVTDPEKNTPYQAYLYTEPAETKRPKLTAAPGPSEINDLGKPYFVDQGVQYGRTDAVRDMYLKQLLKQYDNDKAKVASKLRNSGYLSKTKDITSEDILVALDRAVSAYTVEQTTAYKFEGKKTLETLDEFLSRKKPSDSYTSKTLRDATVFGETDARKAVNAMYQQLQGINATDEQFEEIFPLLQKVQRKNPNVTTTTYDVEGAPVSRVTNTGLDSEQFLYEQLSKTDETKANKVLEYYDIFKRVTGVQ
jgi:hypothetical protein